MAGRQPTGFEYCADAVPEQVWLQLRSWLATDTTIPWERAAEGRRVAQWGFRYDYARHCVESKPVAPIPIALAQLVPQTCGESVAFTQCIINEYVSGDGIPWHRDDPGFGPEVAVFSFGATRTLLMRLPQHDTDGGDGRFSIEPAHRSMYRLSGEAREAWQHSVRGGVGLRYSVTFRSMQGERRSSL